MGNSFWRLVGGSFIFLTAIIGCQRRPSSDVSGDQQQPYAIARPESRMIADYALYTGRTNAMHSVVIQPRVTGYLIEMPFKEGDFVKGPHLDKDGKQVEGDLLFRIDPRPYEAQLKAALAQVEGSKASLEFNQATYQRFLELDKDKKGSVSALDLDKYRAAVSQSRAALDLANANLESAKLNLAWTRITTPIDGQVSRYYLTKGNLVNQDATQLTTVMSMDPMYVYFDIDEPTLLTLKRAVNEGKRQRRRRDHEIYPKLIPSLTGLFANPLTAGHFLASVTVYAGQGKDWEVHMSLAGDNDSYPHKGQMNFFDNQVNPGTGSIQVRAVFDNVRPPGGTYLMTPGMFVRVRLPIAEPREELLVIDRAVSSEQGRKTVYVVDAENMVQPREVTIGSLQDDGLRVITRGLSKDDWVLIGGLQQVRPRMKINTERVSMPSLGKAATPQGGDAKKLPTKQKKK